MNIRLATLRNSSFIFALAFAALLIGCGKSGEKSYGKSVTLIEATPIADILDNPEEYHDTTVRIEGNITEVCQNHGCWFYVADETQRIKVDLEMRSDSYSIPKNSTGKRSVVQGRVVRVAKGSLVILGIGNTIE